jgi:hypothetical protein
MRKNEKRNRAVLLMLALAAPVQAATPDAVASQKEGRAKVDQVAAITLRDVHPLHGGQILYLSADGSGYCQLVTHPPGTPSLYEKRYRLAVPADQLAALWRLLSAERLAAIPSSTQPGVPDASRPRIAARLASGQSINVSRWLHDQQADFDRIYKSLLSVAQNAADKDRLLAEGKFDPNWTPPGF